MDPYDNNNLEQMFQDVQVFPFNAFQPVIPEATAAQVVAPDEVNLAPNQFSAEEMVITLSSTIFKVQTPIFLSGNNRPATATEIRITYDTQCEEAQIIEGIIRYWPEQLYHVLVGQAPRLYLEVFLDSGLVGCSSQNALQVAWDRTAHTLAIGIERRFPVQGPVLVPPMPPRILELLLPRVEQDFNSIIEYLRTYIYTLMQEPGFEIYFSRKLAFKDPGTFYENVQQFLVRIGETRLELNTIPYLVLLHLLKHPTFRPHLCLSENSGYLKLHVLALPLVLIKSELESYHLIPGAHDQLQGPLPFITRDPEEGPLKHSEYASLTKYLTVLREDSREMYLDSVRQQLFLMSKSFAIGYGLGN